MTTQDDIVALEVFDRDEDLLRLEAMLREFNLFDVLGISRREVRHSALLAWLLNPRASHGMGATFLYRFLSDVADQAQANQVGDITPTTVWSWDLEEVRVARERQNIDVLVVGHSDRFVCPIENKINIGEHSGQLGRYMTTVERQWPGWSVLPVFLTPDGKDPERPDDRARYVPYGYERVVSILDRILSTEVEGIDRDVASLLRQYTDTLRRRVMEPTSDVESVAFEIYGKHRAAINRINRALANREKRNALVAQQVFDTPVEQVAGGLLSYDWHNKIVRRLVSPHLDSVCEGEGQMLAFEVKYERDIYLYLWICRAQDDDEVRRRLLNLARSSTAPFSVRSHNRRKLNQGWTWIYRKQVISRDDDSLLGVQATREKIERALHNFCETDYYPLVNAIRWEFANIPWSYLDKAVGAHAKDLQPAQHRIDSQLQRDKRVRFLAPSLDDIPGFDKGIEGYSQRMAAFEFMCLDEPSLGLYLDICPGDEGLRRKIMDGARKAGVTESNWRDWHGYQCLRLKTIIGTDFPHLFDAEKMKDAVNGPIAEFYQKDYYPLVNAIRAEFGLPEVEAS